MLIRLVDKTSNHQNVIMRPILTLALFWICNSTHLFAGDGDTICHFARAKPLVEYNLRNLDSMQNGNIYWRGCDPLTSVSPLQVYREFAFVLCNSNLYPKLSHLFPFLSLAVENEGDKAATEADYYAKERADAVRKAIKDTHKQDMHDSLVWQAVGLLVGIILMVLFGRQAVAWVEYVVDGFDGPRKPKDKFKNN